MYFEPAASPATFDFNAAWWFSYAHRPVTLRDSITGETAFDVIGHQLSSDIVLNVGLFERAALGVDLPFLVHQQGDAPTEAASATLGAYALPSTAMGDVALLGKLTIVKPTLGKLGGFGLALYERFTLPTGDEASFMGEGAPSSTTRLLAEYRYVALSVHGSLGFRARLKDGSFACAPEQTECATTFGHEIPFGLSLVFLPQALGLDDAGRWTWFVETFGHVPAHPTKPFSNAALSQLQIGSGIRFAPGSDVSLLAGFDTALLGGIGNPGVRANLAVAWAPRSHDMDGDGLRDDVDQCPEKLKEDIDGFEDDDGCPDWDNDDDGVPDAEDQCDGEQEDEDGYQDDDGCPDGDNDDDGVSDGRDACPMEPGILSKDAAQNGCPDRDPDKDGVSGEKDRCPKAAEDIDGFEDEDGCPDPDNDGDGIADVDDACPNKKPAPKAEEAEASPDAKREPGKKPVPKAADGETEAEEKPKPGC